MSEISVSSEVAHHQVRLHAFDKTEVLDIFILPFEMKELKLCF